MCGKLVRLFIISLFIVSCRTTVVRVEKQNPNAKNREVRLTNKFVYIFRDFVIGNKRKKYEDLTSYCNDNEKIIKVYYNYEGPYALICEEIVVDISTNP